MQVKELLTQYENKSKDLSIQFLKHSSHYYNMPVFELLFPVRLIKTYEPLLHAITKCEDYLNHYTKYHHLKQGMVRVQILTRKISAVM